MHKTVKELVDQLPEIYQNIYGYPEFDAETSRNCMLRREKIMQIIQEFQKKTGKKDLRILDIGCAQGFYSFSLAEIGCTVDSVDFLGINIELCIALQEENGLACSFQQEVVSKEWAEALEKKYDVVLFLSVIHHIANEHGFQYARELLEILSKKTSILIAEMALKEEPVYWNKNLPISYHEWFENIAGYCKVGDFETHLSEFRRPLIVSSNKYFYLNNVFYKIDRYSQSAYTGKVETEGKRYYLCEDHEVLIKAFQDVDSASEKEIRNEITFLQDYRDLSFVPEILDWEISETRIVEIQKICYGTLLSDLISNKEKVVYENVFSDILDNCVELEKCGLYHKDIHPWNICVDQQSGKAYLIDFGNLESGVTDSVTNFQFKCPEGNISVFDSFIAMVYDCLTGNTYPSISSYGGYHVSLFYDFYRVHEKYRNFMMQCMLLTGDRLNFSNMKKLYQEAVIEGRQYTCSEEDKLVIFERQLRGLDYQKTPYIEFLEKDAQYMRMLNEEKRTSLELQGQVNDLRGQANDLRGQANDLRGQVNDLRGQISALNTITQEANLKMQELMADLNKKERELALLVHQTDELRAEVNSINRWFVLRGYKKIKRIFKK